MAGALHSGVYSGMIVACCEPSVPAGWLFCDGTTVSISQYPDLYNAVLTTYNTGSEPSGTFRLPNLVNNRTPAGAGTTNAGTLAGSNSHNHSLSLGINAMNTNTDGAHTHAQFVSAYTGYGGDHSHTVYAATTATTGTNMANAVGTGSTGGNYLRAKSDHTHTTAQITTNNAGFNHYHNASASSISGGGAHNHTADAISSSSTVVSGDTTASYAPSHQVRYIIKT